MMPVMTWPINEQEKEKKVANMARLCIQGGTDYARMMSKIRDEGEKRQKVKDEKNKMPRSYDHNSREKWEERRESDEQVYRFLRNLKWKRRRRAHATRECMARKARRRTRSRE